MKKIIIFMEWSIDKEVIQYIMDFSKEYYPREFAALLRAKKVGNEERRIYEVIFTPGLISGKSSATYNPIHLPHYFDVVGTVHSHPSSFAEPSSKDLYLFSSNPVNIIVFYPFCDDCWKVYNYMGEEVEIKVNP
jgi:proteasome lid subunit RPN8/RPN11